MDAVVKAYVGEGSVQAKADGAPARLRAGRLNELITADGAPIYREMVSRGWVYAGSTGSGGVANGNGTGTTTNTKHPNTVWNPYKSGVRVSLLFAELAFVSGTWAAGNHFLSQGVGQLVNPTGGGTAITPINALMGSGLTGQSKMATQPASLTNASSVVVAQGYTGAVVTSATFFNASFNRLYSGMFEILDGSTMSNQDNTGTGTSPLGIWSTTVVEIPSLAAQ